LKILPICDLSPYFVSDKVISLADNEEILKSSTALTAAQLILDRVSLKMKNESSDVFSKMILIMEHHGIDAAKILSQEIKVKLKEIKLNDDKSYDGTRQGKYIQLQMINYNIVSTSSLNLVNYFFFHSTLLALLKFEVL